MILKRSLAITVCGILCVTALNASAQVSPELSDSEKKALKIYERLTGLKSTSTDPNVVKMAALIAKGDLKGAAQIATAEDSFYNITVKLMALEMSTRSETIQTPLNDMTASFIGVTRDNTDARELLTGNFYYRSKDIPGVTIRSDLAADIVASNKHFEDLEKNNVNLAQNLMRVNGQKVVQHAYSEDGRNFDWSITDSPDPAGVITSRTFLAEHAIDGTNRRVVEYAFRSFMCTPLTEWADVSATDAWIGRDIDRFPAGDHNSFLTTCKGCHTVMDGFRGAFAKWDAQDEGSNIGFAPLHATTSPIRNRANTYFSYSLFLDRNGIVEKMNKNGSVYPSGYVIKDESFVNNATRPGNMALFGWRGNYKSGNGAKDFGAVIANSRRFSQCMAKRAFKTVCQKNLPESDSTVLLKAWGDEFEASGYRLKALFENIATKPQCFN